MQVFEDIFTGDELFSDSYNPELVDDVIYKVKCSYKKVGPTSVDIGANASAEGQEEETVEDAEQTVIDVVDAFRLQEIPWDKKSFKQSFLEYHSKIKAKLEEANPERAAAFHEGVKSFMSKLPKNLDDTFRYFVGESNDTEGMIILMEFNGSDMFAYFWKDGLKSKKY